MPSRQRCQARLGWQGICIPYYAIFDGFRDTLEVHRLRDGRYEPVPANAAGRYPIAPLGVELGLWYGPYEDAPARRFRESLDAPSPAPILSSESHPDSQWRVSPSPPMATP